MANNDITVWQARHETQLGHNMAFLPATPFTPPLDASSPSYSEAYCRSFLLFDDYLQLRSSFWSRSWYSVDSRSQDWKSIQPPPKAQRMSGTSTMPCEQLTWMTRHLFKEEQNVVSIWDHYSSWQHKPHQLRQPKNVCRWGQLSPSS